MTQGVDDVLLSSLHAAQASPAVGSPDRLLPPLARGFDEEGGPHALDKGRGRKTVRHPSFFPSHRSRPSFVAFSHALFPSLSIQVLINVCWSSIMLPQLSHSRLLPARTPLHNQGRDLLFLDIRSYQIRPYLGIQREPEEGSDRRVCPRPRLPSFATADSPFLLKVEADDASLLDHGGSLSQWNAPILWPPVR
jgi:hypothetical protein